MIRSGPARARGHRSREARPINSWFDFQRQTRCTHMHAYHTQKRTRYMTSCRPLPPSRRAVRSSHCAGAEETCWVVESMGSIDPSIQPSSRPIQPKARGVYGWWGTQPIDRVGRSIHPSHARPVDSQGGSRPVGSWAACCCCSCCLVWLSRHQPVDRSIPPVCRSGIGTLDGSVGRINQCIDRGVRKCRSKPVGAEPTNGRGKRAKKPKKRPFA